MMTGQPIIQQMVMLSLILIGNMKYFVGGTSYLLNEDEEFSNVEALYHKAPKLSNAFDGLSPNVDYEVSASASTSTSDAPQVVITVAIYFDTNPRDIGYSITSIDGTTTYAQANVGTFSDEDYRHRLYRTTLTLQKGVSYRLIVRDTRGDGLEGPSFYAIYYGDDVSDDPNVRDIYDDVDAGNSNIILKEDQFRVAQHEVVFVAERPTTTNPTSSDPPTVSPSPTHAPTGCTPASLDFFRVPDNTKNQNPHFMTSATAFPETSNYCTPHGTYQHCTNERREDCQWQFTSTSSRQGVCRVDPISKCLRQNNCVCNTEDFKSGTADMAEGLLFHVPVSVTTQDIGPYRNQIKHYELYTPLRDHEQDANHPQDDDFYISRADFTARKLIYDIGGSSPLLGQPFQWTFTMNLHYLYYDTPLVGRLLHGMGLSVYLDTSNEYTPKLTINDVIYDIPMPLKRWTCTSLVITMKTFVIAGQEIARDLNAETAQLIDNRFELGSFSGELFDVRIYRGTLSWREIREVGARCTTPDDPAALQYKRDIVNAYYTFGCDPDFERLPADEGGPVPTNNRQTYGSGPFSTLWMKPRPSPFNSDEYIDVPEGHFDEERFFQQAKLQAYMWEKFIFDVDMIGFNLEPYNSFDSADQVAEFAKTFWNNPCRWLHNFNTGWQYPIYGSTIPKWTTAEHGNDDPSAVFDLATIYNTRADWAGGISFVAHEMFHGVQGHTGNAYSGKTSRWFAESTAEFGADFAFPASEKIIAPMAMAPSYPLAMQGYRDKDRARHFMTDELSLNDWIRGGHMYGSWLLWWFLSEHAGMPHIVGQIYSNWNRLNAYTSGELFLVRELVENANMDFGDVWSTCIAHMRTWDFPKFGDLYAEAQEEDFNTYMNNPDVQPPLPRHITLEGRKTTVRVDPHQGTSGQLVPGPAALRPGPNGWNCLTVNRVSPNRFVTIEIAWDHDLGFSDDTKPETIREQQHGCDTDPRFYSSVVVAHNEDTGERRYWKMKGRTPQPLHLFVGDMGAITFHIMLVPTPPTDYVGGIYMLQDSGWDARMSPIPAYGYRYSVKISADEPREAYWAPPASMENGLMKFDEATPGWWPIECTCMENANDPRNRCVRPTFDGVGVTSPPSEVPATESPSRSPSIAPFVATQSPSLSLMPTIREPTIYPTTPPTSTAAPTAECVKWGGSCEGRDACCSQRCFFANPRDQFGRCV